MSQVLCNLLQFAAFKNLFVTLIGEKLGIDGIDFEYEDIGTQHRLGGKYGQPDVVVETEEMVLLVEAKIRPNTGLTKMQPKGYLDYLCNEAHVDTKVLIFLIPLKYEYQDELKKRVEIAFDNDKYKDIGCGIIYWEDLYSKLETSGIHELNIIFDHFQLLLRDLYVPEIISFGEEEIRMLFNKETPERLRKMKELVDEVVGRLEEQYKMRKKVRHIDRYGIYLTDRRNEQIVWFGIWYPYWEKTGRPISIGVDETAYSKAPKTVRSKLGTEFGEKTFYPKYSWYFYGLSEEHVRGDVDVNRIISIITETANSVLKYAK